VRGTVLEWPARKKFLRCHRVDTVSICELTDQVRCEVRATMVKDMFGTNHGPMATSNPHVACRSPVKVSGRRRGTRRDVARAATSDQASARRAFAAARPRRTDREAVGGFVVGAEREALPHRRRLAVGHSGPVVWSVPGTRDLFDPVDEPARKFPIIVRETRAHVEGAVAGDRAHRTRRNTQRALEAWIEFERRRILLDRHIGHDGAQEHEIAEPGMDDVPRGVKR
jgi:hypothetical protein